MKSPDQFSGSASYLEVKLHDRSAVRYCESRESLVSLFNAGMLSKRDEARWNDPHPDGFGRLPGPWQPMKDFLNHDKLLGKLEKARTKLLRRKGKAAATGNGAPAGSAPQRQIGDETQAPPAIRLKPGETPFIDVLLRNNKVKAFSIDELRDQLIAGKLTRHHKARWIEPKPDKGEFLAQGVALAGETVSTWDVEEGGPKDHTLSGEEAAEMADEDYREQRSRWRQRRKWRRIGDGLAREENAIRVLYAPFAVYRERTVPILAGGLGALGAVVGIAVGMMWCFSRVTVGEMTGQVRAFLGAMLFFGIGGAVVVGLAAAAIGYVLTFPAAAIGLCLLPVQRPPDDGFES